MQHYPQHFHLSFGLMLSPGSVFTGVWLSIFSVEPWFCVYRCTALYIQKTIAGTDAKLEVASELTGYVLVVYTETTMGGNWHFHHCIQ